MAYLRPMNSSEANLFTIRFTTPDITVANIGSLDGTNYYEISPSLYDNPTSDLLPSGFIYSIGSVSSAIPYTYKVNFGTMNNPFTEPPTVNISMMDSTAFTTASDNTNIDLSEISVIVDSVTTTQAIFSVRTSQINASVNNTFLMPYDGSNLNSPRFNINILGSVMSGATFAISNRGWNVPESAVNKLYTYQSVGIGTGSINATFNLKGTTSIPALIYPSTTSFGTIGTNIVANSLTILTLPSPIASLGSTVITLPAGVSGQLIRISISNPKTLTVTGSLTISSSCMANNINVNLATSSVLYNMTELYYNSSTVLNGLAIGWVLLYQV